MIFERSLKEFICIVNCIGLNMCLIKAHVLLASDDDDVMKDIIRQKFILQFRKRYLKSPTFSLLFNEPKI